MTLVVMAQNDHYAIQVSDRRLTEPNGDVFTDESGKAIVYNSHKCRLIFGFTGIAFLGEDPTREWLASTLRDVSPPDYEPPATLERLAERLTRKFSGNATLRNSMHRGLTVMFNGFAYPDQGPHAMYGFITNFQNFDTGFDEAPWPEFRLFLDIAPFGKFPKGIIQRVGMQNVFGQDQAEALRAVVASGAAAAAVVDATVEIMRLSADERLADDRIGKQMMSVIVSADTAQSPTGAYHSAAQTSTTYMPTVVVALRDGGVVFSELKAERGGDVSTEDRDEVARPDQRATT